MSHLAPEPPSRRRANRAAGAALVLLGVAVAAVAVVALHNPSGRRAAQANSVVASATSIAPKPTPSAKPPASHPATTATSPNTATSPTSPSTTPTDTTSTANLQSIPLIVLNNTDQTGLADTAAAAEQGGWTVTSTGNLDNDILSTCAYYDPSDPANEQAAERLQQQFPAIQRVEPKFDGLPDGPVVVVLTTDYS